MLFLTLNTASEPRSRAITAKVFVGNLNYQTTKEDLVEFLSGAGEIVDAFLPTDRETGRMRGFAFVTFASEEQATACVTKFNGADLGGRALNINPAEERRRPGGPGGPGGGRPGGGGGFRDGGGRPGGGRPGGGGGYNRGGGGGGGGGFPGGRGGFSGGPGGASGAAPPDPTEYYDDRSYHGEEDGDAAGGGRKGKNKSKGSRRGLRAKKRSI